MDKNATKAYKLTQEGVNFANQGQIEKAIPCFKKSLVYAPNANTYYLLALAYQMIGKITSAEKNYLQAISFNPQFSMAHNNLGAIYLNLKDYHEAIKCFSQAISTDPNNSFAYNNLGNAYKDLNEKDKAIKNYKLALKPSLLKNCKKVLDKNRQSSPLFNTEVFTKNLERAYEKMWEIYKSGEKPTEIIIR